MDPAHERLLRIMLGVVLATPLVCSQAPEAQGLLTEGDRLAWLKNWTAAEPYFAKAEKLFRDGGDARNALYAEISRIRADLPKLSLLDTSEQLWPSRAT